MMSQYPGALSGTFHTMDDVHFNNIVLYEFKYIKYQVWGQRGNEKAEPRVRAT
jgi:hypothetical protein